MLRSRSFSLPKAGNSEEENEDAVFADDARGRYAISDGATEGAYSRAWAHQLVRQYVETPLNCSDQSAEQSLKDWLPVFEVAPVSPEISDHIPWYLEKSLERGSYATLLGVAFADTVASKDVYGWVAVAIGDSCLFQVTGDRVVDSFPLSFEYDFRNSPVLVSTVPSGNEDAASAITRRTGVLSKGDSLLLATDALAAWIINQSKGTQDVVQRLLSLVDLNSFVELVKTERETQRLKNDDSSLLIVELEQAL